jgi:flagellar biosynthesis anti-sigma factor FlgM
LADVRTEKVAEIRGAIESGSYRVDSYQIARKMVDEALRESVATRRG